MFGRERSSAFLQTLLAFTVMVNVPSADLRAQFDEGSEKADLQSLQERLQKLETELEKLRAARGIPPADPERAIIPLVESPGIGVSYYGSSTGSEYFTGRLIVVSRSTEPIVIRRKDITLQVDGVEYKYGDLPANLRNQTVQHDGQSIRLSQIEPRSELRISPGGTASTWLRFANLPRTPEVGEILLIIKVGDQTSKLNVNQQAEQSLDLSVERIGPRGSLLLLTIGGELNSINGGSVVRQLRNAADRKVVRSVIRWSQVASPLTPAAKNWLTQAATTAGRQTNASAASPFPPIPKTIRELHLAEMPGPQSPSRLETIALDRKKRIHISTAAAVRAALQSAYERVPLAELINDIENGSRASRIAALAAGGARLPSDRLPLLLEYADDEDPGLQEAALEALGHFGEDDAVERLVHYVRRDVAPLSDVAITGLAASRFPSAHRALLEVFRNEAKPLRKRIVQVLAKYPRPAWSEAIYEYASDPNEDGATEAIQALALVGHPKLVSLLSSMLEDTDSSVSRRALRERAFAILATRYDEESERIATDYTLRHLETQPPTQAMLTLLNRTRDQRAVPLLLEQLKATKQNRSNTIQTLARIGDQSVADAFVEMYASLSSSERIVALNALSALNSPRYRELAETALNSTQSSLVNAAARGLQEDASPEALEMLRKVLVESKRSSTWSYAATALAGIATPEARAALRAAADPTNKAKSNYIATAFRNLIQRSPGYAFYRQAMQSDGEKKWKDSVEQYGRAIAADGALPEAWSGRGYALLQLQNYKDAIRNFETAEKLDPGISLSVTGKAIALVQLGQAEKGVAIIDESAERFQNDEMFAYNASCVFGLVLTSAEAEQQSATEEATDAFRKRCLEELARSQRLGFNDAEHTAADSDLKSLRGHKEFDAIIDRMKQASRPRG